MAFSFPPTPPQLQEQDKKSQKLWRSMRDFLQKELKIPIRNTHFLLAVSGGADSLALLCLWQWLCQAEQASFSVLHINHGLRPESVDEARSVQALCRTWKIPCFIENINVPSLAKVQKLGVEETARKARYALLEQYRIQCQAAWICLGHHLQDVQEDILMRLIRGTGWPALGGMVAKDAHRHLLRPLLLQQPHTLRTLLAQLGLTWAEDASNTDTAFLRNRVRHTILPLLQAENPSFSQKTAELWHFAQYDAAHWQEIMENLCAQHHIFYQEHAQEKVEKEKAEKNGVLLPAKVLKSLDTATRLRLYVHAVRLLKEACLHNLPKNGECHDFCKEQGQISGQIRAHTLFQLDAALKEGRGNTLFQLPGYITAYVKKGSILFCWGGKIT